MEDAELEQLGINVIRGLAMDAPIRPTPATRARPWRSLPSPTSCSPV